MGFGHKNRVSGRFGYLWCGFRVFAGICPKILGCPNLYGYPNLCGYPNSHKNLNFFGYPHFFRVPAIFFGYPHFFPGYPHFFPGTRTFFGYPHFFSGTRIFAGTRIHTEPCIFEGTGMFLSNSLILHAFFSWLSCYLFFSSTSIFF